MLSSTYFFREIAQEPSREAKLTDTLAPWVSPPIKKKQLSDQITKSINLVSNLLTNRNYALQKNTMRAIQSINLPSIPSAVLSYDASAQIFAKRQSQKRFADVLREFKQKRVRHRDIQHQKKVESNVNEEKKNNQKVSYVDSLVQLNRDVSVFVLPQKDKRNSLSQHQGKKNVKKTKNLSSKLTNSPRYHYKQKFLDRYKEKLPFIKRDNFSTIQY